MKQSINSQVTIDRVSGGNVGVKSYGAKRIAISMAFATFAIAQPSHASANDGVAPVRPVRDSVSQISLRAVERRFAELCDIADEEDITVNRSSYRALKDFVLNWVGARAPAVMLMDDGTFRAVWRSDAEQQVALHFRESGKVQFVVFVRDEEGKMDRATGEASISKIARKLAAFDVKGILSDALVA